MSSTAAGKYVDEFQIPIFYIADTKFYIIIILYLYYIRVVYATVNGSWAITVHAHPFHLKTKRYRRGVFYASRIFLLKTEYLLTTESGQTTPL